MMFVKLTNLSKNDTLVRVFEKSYQKAGVRSRHGVGKYIIGIIVCINALILLAIAAWDKNGSGLIDAGKSNMADILLNHTFVKNGYYIHSFALSLFTLWTLILAGESFCFLNSAHKLNKNNEGAVCSDRA